MYLSLFSLTQALVVVGSAAALTPALAASSSSIHRRTTRLDNGRSLVLAKVARDVVHPRGQPGVPALMRRQSNINCKGSAFCERLGGSCDDALRKVIADNTYSTYAGKQNTGTCSGTCGLFLSGDHCSAKGQELIDAYYAIRDTGHCSHCGQYVRDSDGCMIKIDRVTGC